MDNFEFPIDEAKKKTYTYDELQERLSDAFKMVKALERSFGFSSSKLALIYALIETQGPAVLFTGEGPFSVVPSGFDYYDIQRMVNLFDAEFIDVINKWKEKKDETD